MKALFRKKENRPTAEEIAQQVERDREKVAYAERRVRIINTAHSLYKRLNAFRWLNNVA